MIKHIFNSSQECANGLIIYLLEQMDKFPARSFHIAFSGGSTPSYMFELWADEYAERTDWERLYIYWVDERCVPATSPESNYGVMKERLLDRVSIPKAHVHPIDGENNPQQEAERYSKLVADSINHVNGVPSFDMVVLGAGDDGHTSSIFPGQEYLLTSSHLYEESMNPYTHQKRIAMTGTTMLNAEKVAFLVTGTSKKEVVRDLFGDKDSGPAAYIAHRLHRAELFSDIAATALL